MKPPSAPAENTRLYDRIGPLTDITAFYVDPALNRLTQLASLREAKRIVEVGAGTGRYAARLMQDVFTADARYIDLEPSPRMRDLAQMRLAQWRTRSTIRPLDDALPQEWRGAVDRYIATYVLNVLPNEDAIRRLLERSHDALADSGLLCLVNQTHGRAGTERIISALWMRVYGVTPAILGQCRLLEARQYLEGSRWRVRSREVVGRFGFCSEVLVAEKR
jgi:SAM-dependent methyltransferase